MPSEGEIKCGIGACICVSVIILIIMLISVDTVEPIEYGIVYDSISKTVDPDKVYQAGWYMVGPTKSFVIFPSTQVNKDVGPLKVKDNGGQEIRIKFSIQYRLQEKNIGKLYLKHRTKYDTIFNTYIDAVTRKVIGNFDYTMFWSNRTLAGDLLRDEIDKKLKEVYTDVGKLQIINVQLADKQENSLINTQVTTQLGKTKKMEQQAKQVRSEITVLASESKKAITEIDGKAQALTKGITSDATAKAATMTLKATSAAYLELKNNNGIDPSNGLDKFIFYTELQNAKNPVFLYDVDQAIVKLT